jgi:hypothetical protein
VHCPFCQHGDLIRVKSVTLDDGSIVRLHVCKRCSKRSRWRIKKLSPLGNDEHKGDEGASIQT